MPYTITISEFKKLAKAGRVGKSRQGDKAKAEMENIFRRLNIRVIKEYRFCERQFKFDWAILLDKVAIEYEGLMSEKSGHTTVTGYTSNCEKYNLAIIEGWRVLRYTALNYKQLENDLKKLI